MPTSVAVLQRSPALAVPLVATALLWSSPTAAAQDRVVLNNGVALEGEIKEARRGEVSFDNEELDVVTIDLDDVRELTSPGFFEVTDAVGQVYRGALVAGDSGTVLVGQGDQTTLLNISDIVHMLSFDAGFWGRTNGHVDLGADMAAASSLRSLLLGGLFTYRGPRWGTRHSIDGYWQRQTTAGDLGAELVRTTHRLALNSSVSRFLGRWAVQASVDAEQNEELGLQSRLQIGLLGAYRVVRNQSVELSAGTGLGDNAENYVGEVTSRSAEIIAAAVLDVFDIGDVDVYTSVLLYANTSEGGRFRGAVDGRISWEIIEDFTIGLSLVERLDSRPPARGTRKRDFQYGLTLGWSWS